MTTNEGDAQKVTQIKQFWDEQARKHGKDVLATMPDKVLKELEIQAIVKRLPSAGRVLDLGCGNGFSTLRFAAAKPSLTFTGMDYSGEMVAIARSALKEQPESVQARVQFREGDATRIDAPAASFDVVTTDRCLINLPSTADQLRALGEIHRVLRPGGVYLMCEDTQEGLANLNALRAIVELPAIPMRWHNLYLREADLAPKWRSLFEVHEIDPFSSLYYTTSRVVYAKLAALEGQEPRYDHPINRIAASLPSAGDNGPLKLFVFRKPGA